MTTSGLFSTAHGLDETLTVQRGERCVEVLPLRAGAYADLGREAVSALPAGDLDTAGCWP